MTHAPIVVDAHRHVWRRSALRYPWLDHLAAPSGALSRDYAPEDYQRDIEGVELIGSVLVEAGVHYDDSLREAQWLGEVARAEGPDSSVVAQVDLTEDDLPSRLDRLAEVAPLGGVRQVLNWSGPTAPGYHADRPDLWLDPRWTAGLPHLAARGLCFDLQVEARSLLSVADTLERHPDVVFVLDHGGYLAPQASELDEVWRAGLRRLAALPHLRVKISDYATIDPEFDPARHRDFVTTIVETFGPARSMFASNLPKEGDVIRFSTLVARVAAILGELGDDAVDAVLRRTALDTYAPHPRVPHP